MKMRALQIFLFVAVSLLIISCGGSKPKIVLKDDKPLPSWYLTPPAANLVYLYGVGSGRSMEEATKEALDNLLAQLSVTIESSLEITTKASTTSYSQDSSRTIKSEVAKVKITNYQVESSEQVKYNQFVVLVKTSRDEFANGLVREVDSFFDEYDTRKGTFASSSIVSRYNFFKESSSKAESCKTTVAIAKGVDSRIDDKGKLRKIQSIQNEFERLKQSISFKVEANGKSAKMAEPIKAALAKEKFLVNRSSAILTIFVNVDVSYINASGNKLANVVTTFTIKEHDRSIVGSGRHQFKTNGSNGDSFAIESAASQLALKIEQNGLFDVLGIELK